MARASRARGGRVGEVTPGPTRRAACYPRRVRVHDRIHIFGVFQIPWLKGPRPVRVYVPPDTGAPPPVLYMFDGQNIFDDEPSHSGGWYLHHAARDLCAAGGTAPLIVGIDHGGIYRMRELSPFRMRQRGQAPHLVRWMVDELQPQIRRAFHVRHDLAGTAVGGSSLGGLAALYAHWHRPDVFGAALCMSPSFWVAREKMLKFVSERKNPLVSRLYLDAGGNEPRVRPATERMVKLLRSRGYGPDRMRWVFDPGAVHHESAWRRRAPEALAFLFG
nr:alpha/beta hydrolase-fold protein [Nannocystis pusilla]